MKYRITTLLTAGIFVGVIITLCGCCINFGWFEQKHYERTEQVSTPMQETPQISVDTSFGDVTITGADTNDCNVTAKITGQAPTADEAQTLAEQTHIKFKTEGNTLVIEAEKPHLKKNRSVLISYNIVVPVGTGIKCKSSYGRLTMSNIKGNVTARTSFGDVVAKEITGRIELNTSYGKVDCSQITCAEFAANSSFGDIEVVFAGACPSDLKAKITTSYGSVETDIPTNFAGQVVVETSFGKIKTEVPFVVSGEVSRSRLEGTIGEGSGKLDLKTSFGSITIK
jgi:DUF4097 and DUF4098 domain-containing protein YvlB